MKWNSSKGILGLMGIVAIMALFPVIGSAAPGDNLRLISGAYSQPCGINTGLAFDGTNLLVSCWEHNVIDVLSPADGSLVGTITVPGYTGLNANAWDGTRNKLWQCAEHTKVILVDTSDGSSTFMFSVPACTDGLAYDGTDDTIWASPDASSTVYHYYPNGTLIASYPVGGLLGGFGNSGIAVGGEKLYLANDGGSQIYEVPKDISSSTLFASFPRRLEDMECDDLTFASQGVGAIWSQDAYDRDINAWEIPAGKCGFGGLPPMKGSITGMKFNDLNGNGMKDMGEPGLMNWEITLSNESGVLMTLMTDANGMYNFSDLPDGNYTVGETLQAGWIQTAPAVSGTGSATYAVEISGGSNVMNRDFGNFKLGSVHGMKFNDMNGNGRNDNEPGLEGWEITIDGFDTITNTPVHMTTMTDANGKYWFMGLTAGTYTISETLKNGWMQTAPPMPGTYTVTIDTSGMVVEGLDFGNQRMPPEAECVETVNPAGNNIPTAGANPKSGQNPDGFYELLAKDMLDPSPMVFVKDTGSGTIFGPYPSGVKIKYTEANGAMPEAKPMTGAIDWHIKGKGDAAVYAVNNGGVKSPEVLCKVPPPPK